MNRTNATDEAIATMRDSLTERLKAARAKVEGALEDIEDFCTNTDRVVDNDCMQFVVGEFAETIKDFMQAAKNQQKFMADNYDAIINMNRV